jgi:hypothetical protein
VSQGNGQLRLLNNYKYTPVGYCIYCGNTRDLQDEHILPYGLGGSAVLPKASCAKCSRITGQMEQQLLRGSFWQVRLYRKLQSRTKHRDAPAIYPLRLVKNGIESTVSLPLAEYPILIPFLDFGLPGYLENRPVAKGIPMKGLITISFGPKPEQVAARFGAKNVKITVSENPVPFARVIAKIAFSWAFAEGYIQKIVGPSFVIPAILGDSDDIGHWVGTISAITPKELGMLHQIVIREDKENNVLLCGVHLFADSNTPFYGVVLGKLH